MGDLVDLAQERRLRSIGAAIAAELMFTRLARLQHAVGEISGATLDRARCATISELQPRSARGSRSNGLPKFISRQSGRDRHARIKR